MNNLKKENADAFGLTAFKYIFFSFKNTKNYYLQVLLDRKNSEMGGQPIPLHVLSKRTTCQKFWRQKLRSTLRLRKKKVNLPKLTMRRLGDRGQEIIVSERLGGERGKRVPITTLAPHGRLTKTRRLGGEHSNVRPLPRSPPSLSLTIISVLCHPTLLMVNLGKLTFFFSKS